MGDVSEAPPARNSEYIGALSVLVWERLNRHAATQTLAVALILATHKQCVGGMSRKVQNMYSYRKWGSETAAGRASGNYAFPANRQPSPCAHTAYPSFRTLLTSYQLI